MADGNWFYQAVIKSDLTTKDTKITKFGVWIIQKLRVLRDLRGENSFPFVFGRVALGAFVVSSLLVMPPSAQESVAAAAPILVRVGFPQPSGAQLPLWVMSEAKLDQKYGFDLQNIYISGGAIVDEAYDSFRGIFPKVPYFTEDNIRAVLSVADPPKAAGADSKDFLDNCFIKELEDIGFIKELYASVKLELASCASLSIRSSRF